MIEVESNGDRAGAAAETQKKNPVRRAAVLVGRFQWCSLQGLVELGYLPEQATDKGPEESVRLD